MGKEGFDRFINKKVTGAKKKEQIKQEKKKVKKEREAFFIEKKRQQRAEKKLMQDSADQFDDRKKAAKSAKPVSKTPAKAYGKEKPAYTKGKTTEKIRPVKNLPVKPEAEAPNKPLASKVAGRPKLTPKTEILSIDAPPKKSANLSEKPKVAVNKDKKEFSKTRKPERQGITPKPANDPGLPYARKPLKVPPTVSETPKPKATRPKISPVAANQTALMPLNKYIAHGGLCSRRDAGEWVKSGKVKLNGQVVTDPGTKVKEGDEVFANGKKVVLQNNLVYILLNKPKDFITTVDDPQGRKTVLDIVKGATNERVYPVGRLDRNTSGVLLLTNDGELAQQLTHPSYEVKKIYEARLDKPLTKADFEKLLSGITLEDGLVRADSVAYADSRDKSIIGIEIHSGRNRVVRRMFESLGYDVKGLDRVLFANLTKKNVERGKWRLLSEKEVRLLKFFNKSKGPNHTDKS